MGIYFVYFGCSIWYFNGNISSNNITLHYNYLYCLILMLLLQFYTNCTLVHCKAHIVQATAYGIHRKNSESYCFLIQNKLRLQHGMRTFIMYSRAWRWNISKFDQAWMHTWKIILKHGVLDKNFQPRHFQSHHLPLSMSSCMPM